MKRALIFGRAQGTWEEFEQAKTLCDFDTIIGVGKAGCDYSGELHHWVSFHTDLMPHWIDVRERNGYPPAGQFWSCNYKGRSARYKSPVPVTLVEVGGGSSGFVAVMVALEGLSINKVVLAGIPMTNAAGHYDETGDWNEAHKYQREWKEKVKVLEGRVKSMSGWTQELLGAPTLEWLLEE
jgi:hypothetical protein